MNKSTRSSGLSLVVIGLLVAVFFWLTDPRYGIWRRFGAAENPVDAANQAFIGTALGIVGAVLFVVIGLWLLTRRDT